MTKSEFVWLPLFTIRFAAFVIRDSDFFRHSSFGIRHFPPAFVIPVPLCAARKVSSKPYLTLPADLCYHGRPA